ncbi:PLP-dependent transferase [Tenacibaculum finnmarkense genomovar finnmarkense]|uniref:PLP-dependent transferase n=1 Tax=Tenacibaculum finnmarkense TaxID=2781243 RepID=UPI001E376DED|nr:PLP-dependent transferase [Tenacibaculum finnmarkense]MCD8417971.1 PLP-dependent transferase [Tenacibaculum finnmarkense genomovar finnmarkense]MCG8202911.1 PLP-dependent transferase [Tenacibaculum finnmarkense genomovar finnmarkense]MCG8210159.1 PLP-dependent transferase [Tenacibaculum finnmarkense genomovar finnmarkense]MCG8213192.1 PLP-dependent transferase [Tenacibaculum finnmarkense genomovar finnmarkense]MCG8225879.1 PLP-dependent transferase [Tenacibaculum finnmarkense genomovar finn
MQNNNILDYIKEVLKNMPADWLTLTTHRLDIYNEKLAKVEFTNQFESLFNNNNSQLSALSELPTAYDYIRLGHPLSCVLEWVISKMNDLNSENIISFSSTTMPILAILRSNLQQNKNTQIIYSDELPSAFNADVLQNVYGYKFELKKITDKISNFDGSTILISEEKEICNFNINNNPNIDFFININTHLGSVLAVNKKENQEYISAIQHVRRRESIAMTPADSLAVLQSFVAKTVNKTSSISSDIPKSTLLEDKASVLKSIQQITQSTTKPLVASSGLSIQYAILMGLVDHAQQNNSGKTIKIVVPPNCYGGTNDQARRVAACLENVEIVDLLVDGGNDMVKSIDAVLAEIALEDAVPFIIAEIPTNPRVEVPNLDDLRAVLTKKRTTNSGTIAVDPVFILDQTFCPNVHFLGENAILSSVRTISFASGSKFPSGGKCTAGYCVGNKKSETLIDKIAIHLNVTDNEATDFQYEILAKQLPSMNQRIIDAYKNTREFVTFITDNLPGAKINFVSEELASQGFTPSVFSLDLPTKGNSDAEKETYKRALNLKLINLMITEIPTESKFCVSYGQLKGCYWTIPATSTQGTTKEGDKDYIVRASLSANMDLELHKKVFLDFVKSI